MLRPHFPGGPVFEAVPEPGPLSPEYVAPAPAQEEAAWTGPTQEEWERLNGAYDQIAELPARLEQMMQQPQYPQNTTIDPFADDFQAQLDSYMEQRMAPFRQAQQTWEQQEGTERARDILNDNVSREGEFILEGSTGQALRLAETYLPEFQAKYGATAQAAEAAINAAAGEIRDYEQKVGEAYHQRQMNQFRKIGEAPREPGTATAAATQAHVIPPGGDEMSVVRHYGGIGR